MNIIRQIFAAFLLFCGLSMAVLPAQEALKSAGEDYYDFLALQGILPRPTLNYRTLSDSAWELPDNAEHPWQDLYLGRKRALFGDVSLRIYGPELFTSYNTAAPYGQNDGALWQGKGFNGSLTGGARLEGYGVELTFKPQLAFSQNAAFDLMPPAYSGANYADKAGIYGYYGVRSIDAPQRFGDAPFFTYDWGDSEIRYTWKTLTIGFGTEAIWLGPGRVNSILHSNNAPTYPKLDIGLRRQSITLPWVNWYLGDVEVRLWGGYLSESDYFDNDDSNDHNLMSALAVAYAPSFLPGLTLFANRNFLTKWKPENFKYFGELFFVTVDNDEQIQEKEDQRVSLGADWLLPAAGIEIYGEIGINDYVAGKTGYIRYPFSTMAYTVGLRKSVAMHHEKKVYGELLFEWNHLEMSQNYQFHWPTTFYAHHLITQGYTNKGQWLGAGIGTGGNGQYLGFKVYYPKGYGTIFVYRFNPDNDYLYATTIKKVDNDADSRNWLNYRASLSIGLDSSYFITKNISLFGSFIYNLILNPLYNFDFAQIHDTYLHNFHLGMGTSFYF
jgi:hypothetical protein